MTTYVLGAGASLHAGYPLAGQLGNAVRIWLDQQDHPVLRDCRAETHYLDGLYGGLQNFEDILTDLEDPAPGSPCKTLDSAVRARLSGQFLTSIRTFIFGLQSGRASLYGRLARERVRPGDTVITFNYDVEVERELKKAGLWEVTDGYGFPIDVPGLPCASVPVLKLHGSANWLGLIFKGSLGFGQVSDSGSVGRRPVIFGSCDFQYLGYPNAIRDPECSGVTRSAAIPAMIMPTRRKKFYMRSSFGLEWEDFWKALWAKARNALVTSKEVFIIGYSMAPADERARSLLLDRTNPEARITVCCGKSSRRIASEFATRGFAHVRISGDGTLESLLDDAQI